MGAWIARAEVKARREKLRKLLVEHGLEGSLGDVLVYLQVRSACVSRLVARGWCRQPTMH